VQVAPVTGLTCLKDTSGARGKVAILKPDGFASGRYKVPEDAGTVRVKITDLLSESWEGSIDA
tara:strand:+ start:1110 stop:1298 length:189 start_codon:yes stop_codon:yes gene_type:complete